MGDWFQVIADVGAAPEEAERLAADVRAWLVSSGIVAPGRTGCVYGAGSGHRPGPCAGEVVQDPGWAPSWRDLEVNGLAVVTGRTVFDTGQGDPAAVRCPHCGVWTQLVDEDFELLDGPWELFGPVVHGWGEGREVVVGCPACGRPVEPAGWRWADDCLALAHLGFTFWNWPPLRPEFTAEFARRLGGHRTVLLEGKL